MNDIKLVFDDSIATLSLARASKKNALTRAMWLDLQSALAQAQKRASVLILRAEGNDFCAGADLGELREHLGNAEWMQANHEIVQSAQDALYRCTIPTIAVIQGNCVGGGVGLATACDFRFASVQSQFSLTPAKLGLAYSVSDCKRLIDLIGPARAREMLFTGASISAVQALTYGLIHQMHAPNTIEHAVQTLSANLRQQSGGALAAIKANLLAISDGQRVDDQASRLRFASLFASADFARAAEAFSAKAGPKV
jgi:enoyl-CoA hydratase